MHLVILMYALFASMFTLAKGALLYSGPLFLVGSRMVFAGFLLLAYQRWQGELKLSQRAWRYWGQIFLLGLTAIYLTNACEFWGLQYLTSFKACFIYSLSPFFSALLAYWMWGETLSAKKWLGLSVGFIGFIPIFASEATSEESVGHFLLFSWAELALVAAALAAVYGWIILKNILSETGESPIQANGLSMLLGGAMALFHSFLSESWSPSPVSHWGYFSQFTLLMVLISNCICFNLYGVLLKRYTATFLSFAGFMTPIFAAVYGQLFLGETLTLPFILSGAVVFVGLGIFYLEELRSGVHQVEMQAT